jgi:hypothetical protein
MMVDSLNMKLEVERRMGRIHGLQIARGVKELNYSQFVDDSLILGTSSSIIARIFKIALDHFLKASRGCLNLSK